MVIRTIATVYGEGAYSAGSYSCTSAQPCQVTSHRSIFANLGFDLLLLGTLIALAIAIGMPLRIWRQNRRRNMQQPPTTIIQP